MRFLPLLLALLIAGCGSEAPEIAGPPSEPTSVVDTPVVVSEVLELVELDPETGLKMTGDWMLVRSNCVPCHSASLITQQRGDAAQWLGMIRWMQAKQNLWQFDPDTEARIVAYLAENYPPEANRRRAALPADQLPPNPYSTPSAETGP